MNLSYHMCLWQGKKHIDGYTIFATHLETILTTSLFDYKTVLGTFYRANKWRRKYIIFLLKHLLQMCMCPLPNDHLICRNILHQLYNLSSCPPTHAFLCSNNPTTMIYFKLCFCWQKFLRNCDLARHSEQHLH